jgi:perosamine synthetase
MSRIPVAGPWITQREIDYVTDAATRCWGADANYYHERFEAAFAEYVGVKHAIAVTHCTSAIHLSLAALNIGPGDEVVIPDVTWIASAAPVSYVGAVPVFADIDPVTWCLSAESFEANITERTRAVIVVDLYGSMPDQTALRTIADQHGIAVIEDAAEAFGSELDGKKAGSFGDTGVFSFHGSKTMTTGEGGMLVTDRDDIRDRVLFLRDHGRIPGDVSFYNHEVAFKYRMSSMQAALGLAQVERADELVSRKREIFRWYAEDLSGVSELSLNSAAAGVRNSYWMSTAVCDPSLGLSKESLGAQLAEDGVDTRPFFHPLSSIPAYQDSADSARARTENTTAYSVSPYGVNLPSGMSLTRDQASAASRALQRAVRRQADGSEKAA